MNTKKKTDDEIIEEYIYLGKQLKKFNKRLLETDKLELSKNEEKDLQKIIEFIEKNFKID